MINLGTYICIFFMLPWGLAMASTTEDINSKCTYIDAKGDVKFATACRVSFGLTSVKGDSARYTLTFANKNEVTIFETANSATVNGVPAEIAHGNGRLSAVTNKGEVFIFSIPTED